MVIEKNAKQTDEITWQDWSEPLELLLEAVQGFICTLKRDGCIRTGNSADAAMIKDGKEKLRRALCEYLSHGAKSDAFLEKYVYTSEIYKDAFGFVFEYIGESQHMVCLDGNEVPKDKQALIHDFCLYIE